MYDCIVIGAGIAGAACARKLAEEAGKKVLVIERRSHIGGNCYDVPDEYGILIHEYGPHIFHTGLEEVYEYLLRLSYISLNFCLPDYILDRQSQLSILINSEYLIFT